MAGIYIHVPYCKSRCIYCDFFTQTNLSSRADYVSTLCKEIELRKDYVDKEIVRTIYFGGGTPSLLSLPDLDKILNSSESNRHYFNQNNAAPEKAYVLTKLNN